MSRGIHITTLDRDEYVWVTYDDRPHDHGYADCPVPHVGPDSLTTWDCPDCGTHWVSSDCISTGVIPWTE